MQKLIALDIETTGIEPSEGHRIIEIGCVEIIDEKMTNTYHQYIYPNRLVGNSENIHGITDDFLQGKPQFADIAQEFLSYIKNSTLIIHNAEFDISFLNHEFGLMGLDKNIESICDIIDTLEIFKMQQPFHNYHLDALSKYFEIETNNKADNNALSDAKIVAQVYLAMGTCKKPRIICDLETACGNDDIDALKALGYLYKKGHIVKQSDVKAMDYWQKACDLGSGDACSAIAYAYMLEGNEFKAIEFYQKACELEDGDSCNYLGVLHQNNKNYILSIECYQKSCHLDKGEGCLNLGLMYDNGHGIEANDEKALKYYKKSCELGDGEACYHYGLHHDSVINPVNSDEKIAMAYYKKACDLDNADGCWNLAVAYGVSAIDGNMDEKEANDKVAQLFQKGCNLGSSFACSGLADAYKQGEGVKKSIVKAWEFDRKACELDKEYCPEIIAKERVALIARNSNGE
ncbi:DNA polymerase III epsilon subunit [uncultured Candidatus Thioglobus sp.]|nr:DNA polymerase III epsilon subunit [uncultured Candidatus Thioglobus sp.]